MIMLVYYEPKLHLPEVEIGAANVLLDRLQSKQVSLV